MNTFNELGLHPTVLKAVAAEGYETPTPIQAQAIPHLLQRRDLLGVAQTGTGKTAAFALPTIDHLIRNPARPAAKSTRVLVLAPTRELAQQIADDFRTYSAAAGISIQTVYGGVKISRQIRDMEKGAHVLVATPGRLVDLMGQGAVRLEGVEILILDEFDQMLDQGFLPDIRRIVGKTPKTRQTLLFSATAPAEIAVLAEPFLREPVRVSVTPQSTTAERVTQGVLHVATEHKIDVLAAILAAPDLDRVLVFTRTKHGADRVVQKLAARGLEASAIHGDKSQPQRMRALSAFREGRCRVLVATDIAARGIDVDGVSHVVNYEMPNVAEHYVHRIGRTARAGREGIAISLVADDELYYLRDVEKTTRVEVGLMDPPSGCEALIRPAPSRSVRPVKPKGPAGRGGQGGERGQRPGAPPFQRDGRQQAFPSPPRGPKGKGQRPQGGGARRRSFAQA